MNEINIIDKLTELGCPLEELSLGDFDYIGEFTAKKTRNRDNPLYKTAGCFFRPNYERGMLAHALIKKYKPKSILEIGFGRGYWSLCAARALTDFGIDGKITTIDIKFDQTHLSMLSKYFPNEWLSKIEMIEGNSSEIIKQLETQNWDLVYIDGNHTYEGVLADWLSIKDKCNIVVFDDYHKPTKNEKYIEVAKLVNELEYRKELVVMDRLIFNDDRFLMDKDYGQIIMYLSEDNTGSNYEYNW
jgi:predicted O-methyltransferase YrrM